MKRKIISVDFVIPGDDSVYCSYLSEQSLLDADVIVFNPLQTPFHTYSLGERFQGKACFNENSSFKVQEATSRWKTELTAALKHGKTVIILFAKYEDYFVFTGQKHYSGTGKNARATNMVANTNNYEFCPINLGKIVAKGGSEIRFLGNPLLSQLWSDFSEYFTFEAYIDSKLAGATFLTKTGEKTIGAIIKVELGHVVLLPPISYDRDEFTDTTKTGVPKWNDEGLAFGARLCQVLLDIDSKLRASSEKTTPPKWVSNSEYELKQANETQEQINKTEKEIKKLENQKKHLESVLVETQALHDLLFEQGKPLEQAVTRALKLLGFNAENYDDGTLELDQVITSPEGHRYIGECEGKNEKDIDISKFRQLSESLSADFAREEVTEKAFGILFGNPQRTTEPDKRTLDFTAKCKIGAEREKIALVKTTDLFQIAKYLQENIDEDFKLKCREAIYSCLGKIVVFPAPNTVEH